MQTASGCLVFTSGEQLSSWGGKSLFHLTLPHHSASLRELKQEPGGKDLSRQHGRTVLIGLLLRISPAIFSYIPQDHLLGSSTTHSGMGLLIAIISEENAYGPAWQPDGDHPSIEIPSSKIILAFVKVAKQLTSTVGQ